MMKSNFLIIGAQKAGTTSLFYYLSQHPEIYMYPGKEIDYFSNNLNFPELNANLFPIMTPKQYEDLFILSKNAKAVGEASTSYLCSKDAPRRIFNYDNNIQLIAVLRNPVERAYSNFLHALRKGEESITDFGKAIKLEEYRIQNGYSLQFQYIQKGYYFKQLMLFYRYFEKSQLKIFLFEDLNNDARSVTKQIFEFLNVDANFYSNIEERHNTSGLIKINFIKNLRFLLRKNFFAFNFIKKIVPYSLRKNIKSYLYYQPIIPENIRLELIELYRGDILDLQNLLNRDLSAWLT